MLEVRVFYKASLKYDKLEYQRPTDPSILGTARFAHIRSLYARPTGGFCPQPLGVLAKSGTLEHID